jgi:murein DD-endopeptidase MepM/ murein hydrolase activator NlpD
MPGRMASRLRLLLVAAAAPLLLWLLLPMLSSGASRPTIRHRIDSKQAAIDRHRGRERVLTTDIAAYTSRIDALQSDITTLQERQVALQTDLDAKRAELERIQADLRAERLRLIRLKARLEEAKRALAARLVELYKADRADIVTVVLNANGFQQLLESADFMHRISAQDARILDRVRVARLESIATARHLAVLQRRAEAVAASIQSRRDEVIAVKGRLVARQQSYSAARSQKARALASTRSQRHSLEDDVAALQRQSERIAARIRAAAARAAAASTGVAGPVRQGSGRLIWPVNGPITSPFCESRAWESCHPGIDIGVPSGTPIRAAASGRVVVVQSEASSGGYGNFTCVQHSASLSTCYAHQSSFATSMGASVSQGQVIGYTGCTGLCFGPHLHFEVRVNGSVVDPLGYL